MKLVCFVIILLICFCVIYYKIYKREEFMRQVKTVTDISDLEQNTIYLVHDKELFSDDIEYFYKDSKCKNRIEKKYIKANQNLLWQIAARSDEIGEIVFPMLIKPDGTKIKFLTYEEIWSKRC